MRCRQLFISAPVQIVYIALGTVPFYGTATINLIWQHMGLD